MSLNAPQSASADINVFRGLAAVAVLALHARESTWVGMHAYWSNHHFSGVVSLLSYITFPVVWGSIGVPIFFVLSGYCIHRSQAQAARRDPESSLAVGTFYLRRLFRIYPVLVGALLLTAICDNITRSVAPGSDKLGDCSIHSFLVNLFSLQGVAGAPYGSNGALWTLSLEIQFYALYPLLIVARRYLGKARLTAALAIVAVGSYPLFERNGVIVFSAYYISWWLGALVAEAHVNENLDFLKARHVWSILGGVLLLFVLGNAAFFVNQFLAFHIWSVSFAGGLALVVRRKKPFGGPISRLFEWLGGFSYSIYIVHLPLIILLRALLFDGERQDGVLIFYASIPYAIACAYLFYWVFERPSVLWSQRVRGKRSAYRSIASPVR